MPHPLWDMLRASYDRSASDYDAQFAALQALKFDALLERVDAAVLAGPKLDLGCGTGLLATQAGGRWVGLDLSRGMLNVARERSLPVQALGDRLPFADASFGLVAAVTVLRILDAPVEPTLAELDRVLRPGGLALLSVLRGRDDGSVSAWLEAAGYQVDAAGDAGQDVAWVACKPG